MKEIVLFTKMSSIKIHWQKALDGHYLPVYIDKFTNLIEYLQSKDEHTTLMLDEMSVTDINDALKQLQDCKFVTVLLFNAMPEAHHASTLLREGIKGYENSYINKNNLLKMLTTIEHGHSWFFSDLTNYIINKYVKSIDKHEPDFMHLLTSKEKDIALMIADGFSNKEIAQKEKIALSTVKGHTRHIFEKAGVSDRISLALKFR